MDKPNNLNAATAATAVVLRCWGKPAREVLKELKEARAWQRELNRQMPTCSSDDIDLAFFPFIDAICKRVDEEDAAARRSPIKA